MSIDYTKSTFLVCEENRRVSDIKNNINENYLSLTVKGESKFIRNEKLSKILSSNDDDNCWLKTLEFHLIKPMAGYIELKLGSEIYDMMGTIEHRFSKFIKSHLSKTSFVSFTSKEVNEQSYLTRRLVFLNKELGNNIGCDSSEIEMDFLANFCSHAEEILNLNSKFLINEYVISKITGFDVEADFSSISHFL